MRKLLLIIMMNSMGVGIFATDASAEESTLISSSRDLLYRNLLELSVGGQELSVREPQLVSADTNVSAMSYDFIRKIEVAGRAVALHSFSEKSTRMQMVLSDLESLMSSLGESDALYPVFKEYRKRASEKVSSIQSSIERLGNTPHLLTYREWEALEKKIAAEEKAVLTILYEEMNEDALIKGSEHAEELVNILYEVEPRYRRKPWGTMRNPINENGIAKDSRLFFEEYSEKREKVYADLSACENYLREVNENSDELVDARSRIADCIILLSRIDMLLERFATTQMNDFTLENKVTGQRLDLFLMREIRELVSKASFLLSYLPLYENSVKSAHEVAAIQAISTEKPTVKDLIKTHWQCLVPSLIAAGSTAAYFWINSGYSFQ